MYAENKFSNLTKNRVSKSFVRHRLKLSRGMPRSTASPSCLGRASSLCVTAENTIARISSFGYFEYSVRADAIGYYLVSKMSLLADGIIPIPTWWLIFENCHRVSPRNLPFARR